MTDPPGEEKPERWRRFTLLDMLLIQAALAAALSIAWSSRPTESGWIEPAIAAVVFGSVFAGPMVLISQWTLRGRRTLPSTGEQLWIASFVCWTAGFYLIVLLYWLSEHKDSWPNAYGVGVLGMSVCTLCVVQTILSGIALVWLVKGALKKHAPVPCLWTDRCGSIACLLFGLWPWITWVGVVLVPE